ncbi:MAG: PEP-CTERM sorting domain-containing protein [Bryobacteraceae bacterium]
MLNRLFLLTRALFPVLAVLIAGSDLPVAHASILYSSGFETPTFTTGPIAGQDGWNVFGPGNPIVDNFFSDTGTQAVFVDGNEASQTGPYHTDVTTGPIVDLSSDIAIFTSTTQTEWQFAGLDPTLTQFLGGIDILPDDAIVALTAGSPVIGAFPRATGFDSTAWHSIDLLFNLSSQTYSISLDGATLASNLAFCGDSAGCAGASVSSYGGGLFDTNGISSPGVGASGSIPNDSGYMDNFQVADVGVPEPSTILLLGLGLAGAACRLRRR